MITVVIFITFVLIICKLDVVLVNGTSMMSILEPGDLVLYLKTKSVKSNRIAVIQIENDEMIIKRILYTRQQHKSRDKEIYIIGDNPMSSVDSRQFGWISNKAMRGIALIKMNGSEVKVLFD